MASQMTTYIFSSVYSFSAEGAAEVIKRFESTPEGANAICAYDHEMETFCFECERIRGEHTFRAFHNLLEKYVREEVVHDVVFENPKVERLDATSDKPIEWVDPRGLIALEDEIDDSDDDAVQDTAYGNAYSTTWRPKLSPSNLTGRFAPDLVGVLSRLTDCVFYMDQDKGEIKVTGSTKEALELADRKLENLERQLRHHALGPKIVHLIETEKEMDFVLRFIPLRQLAKTLRNTLVAHDFQHTATLHKFFVVRLLKLDAKSQQYLAPNTKVQPVLLTSEASALPGLWAEFKFKRIGTDRHNSVTLSKEPESIPIPDDEVIGGAAGASIRKVEMVNQWVQEGSSEVLNPFLPVQGHPNTMVSSTGKAGGSATQTKAANMSSSAAASTANMEQPPRPPSPRKRFGKVRRPKGGPAVDPLESSHTQLEDKSDLNLTDQAKVITEDIRPDRALVRNMISGNSHFGSPATVTELPSTEKPNMEPQLSPTGIVAPEILPPYVEPVTEDVMQDQSPAKAPEWEKCHAHATGVGRLVDVPPLSYTPRDVTDAQGYKSAIDTVITERRSAPSHELISLLDATEEEYPKLSTPLNPLGATTTPLVKRPTAPLKPILQLRIVNPEKPVPASNSFAESATSKAKTDKAPSESLQTSNEVETRKFRHTMGQRKPVPRKEKTDNGKEIRASKPAKNNFRKLNAAAEDLLERGMYFRGQVKMEVQIGRIMVENVPNHFKKMHFPVNEWPAIFAAREASDLPSTIFTNMLTTAMLDVIFIRDLNTPGGERMFSSQPSECIVTYEFNCMTKESDEINVVVDENAEYHVSTHSPRRSELDTNAGKTEISTIPLGSINWYYPKRTWDAKASLTGIVNAADTYQTAVKALIDNLHIPDGNSLLDLVTKTVAKDLRIQAVTLRRQNRYGSMAHPSISLCITEIQDLYIQRAADSTDLIRARAKPPGEMIHDNRLWYEVSLSSSVAEEKFKENVDLELGDVSSWTPREMVEAGVFENLSLVARDVVTRIDNVGHWNKGPRGGPSDGAMTTPSTTNAEEAPGFW